MAHLSPEDIERIKEEQRLRTTETVKTGFRMYLGFIGKIFKYGCGCLLVIAAILAIVYLSSRGISEINNRRQVQRYEATRMALAPTQTAAEQAQLTEMAVRFATPTIENPGPITGTEATSALQPTLQATFTPTITVTQTPQYECDRAYFVGDISIPDGTDLTPGATFVKTWQLRNDGICEWNADYVLIFESGDMMSGPATQSITSQTVMTGQTVDISITFTAPLQPGTYQGFWKLRNPSGIVFGIGGNNEPIHVLVDVVQ